MPRAALLALLLLLPSTSLAAQTPDQAYEACLLGHSVTGVLQADLAPPDAYYRAAELCADVGSTVPEDYCPGESCGPGAVEEAVIHYWESVVAPLLAGEPGSPLVAPENTY